MKSYIALISLCTGLCTLVFCCTETKKSNDSVDDFVPVFVFDSMSSSYNEKGKVQFKRFVHKLIRNTNGDESYPNGISMQIFNENKEIVTTLVADSGVYDKKTDIYTVMGNVVVVNLEKEQTLKTPLLNWSREKEKIYTDTVVQIINPNQIIDAKGMEADEQFEEYTLKEVKSKGSKYSRN